MATLTGAAIARDALRYVGAGYVFGGDASKVGLWDCSSFCSWVLGHDLGLALPGGKWGAPGFPPNAHGPVVLAFSSWSGSVQVNTPQAGDLCIWSGAGANGHIGIALGPSSMVSALNPTDGTRETPILGTGPAGAPLSFRRVSGLAAGAAAVGAGLSGSSGGGGILGAIGRFIAGVGEIPARLAVAASIAVAMPFIVAGIAALIGTVGAVLLTLVIRKLATA